MIEVIVSKTGCPHCEEQLVVMQKSFFPDEYRVLEIGSPSCDAVLAGDNLTVDAVPFIVVRAEDGSIAYADKGRLDGTALRKIERLGTNATEKENKQEKVFNLREARAGQTQSVWVD